MGIGYIVGVIGVLILSHAAYSTIQYRALLKITEEEFSGPTLDVVFELLLGLILCMWAALTVPGKFLSILPHSDENRQMEQFLFQIQEYQFSLMSRRASSTIWKLFPSTIIMVVVVLLLRHTF